MTVSFATLAATAFIGVGTTHAESVCAPEDEAGISWCSDGSWQHRDDRGHLLVFNPDGTVRLDLAPDQPWY